jgi:hypothetical protein
MFLVWHSVVLYCHGRPQHAKVIGRQPGPAINISAGADPTLTQTIQRILEVLLTQGMRTLGIRLAADGNDSDKFKFSMEATLIDFSQLTQESPTQPRAGKLELASMLSGKYS